MKGFKVETFECDNDCLDPHPLLMPLRVQLDHSHYSDKDVIPNRVYRVIQEDDEVLYITRNGAQQLLNAIIALEDQS